jgi:zinc/manganese transport system substrate-binding protein
LRMDLIIVPWVFIRNRVSRREGLRGVTVVLVVFLFLAACSADISEPSQDGLPVVVVSTGIWGNVVANVACDGLAEIVVLVPDGADPHAYEPSLADRAVLERAGLVVANGLGLEGPLEDVLALIDSQDHPVFRFMDHIDPLSDAGSSGRGGSIDVGDPHAWFDPNRVLLASQVLAEELVNRVALDPGEVAGCLSAFRAELEALDQEVIELVETIAPSQRRLVTNHDALGYFAERYGFEVIGSVLAGSSSVAESNPAWLEELAQEIRASRVRTIFVEEHHSGSDAYALADRVGDVQVAHLYIGSLGPPGSGADTYVGLIRTAATMIANGLA